MGDYVCKYGITSDYSCGTIVDDAFDGVNKRVNTSVQGGDSGGPWFLGNIAYGTTISSLGTDSVYGPVDHICNILGLTVMVESELHQTFWRDDTQRSRSVPIVSGSIQWGSASNWWTGPFTLGSLPGSESIQAESNFIVGEKLWQAIWRNNEGWSRTVDIVNNDIDWGSATGWSGPLLISALPGSGSMQAAGDFATNNTLWQTFWRGNQGWFRTVPIVNGIVQWGSASSWPTTPIPISALPGSDSMQSQSNYLVGNTLWQAFWRGSQGWSRTVPVVSGVVQWGSASGWSGPTPIGALPGSGTMQGQSDYAFP